MLGGWGLLRALARAGASGWRERQGELAWWRSEEEDGDFFFCAEVPVGWAGTSGNTRNFQIWIWSTNSTNSGRKYGAEIDGFGGNRRNWPVKIGGMIDQHQRQRICGPKPQTTQQILRSKFELFFGENILGNFLGKIGGIGGSNPWQPLL
jgi:hypothetical protein